MTVIVTMAGAGSRFRLLGYETPKYMIRARGKTLFEWSMTSLQKFFDQKFIFACLDEHDADWIKQSAITLGINYFEVAPRPSISLGQAQTAYDVIGRADSNEHLWIFNIDTYIEEGLSPSDILGYQGCVHVFESTNPGMSFVRYNKNQEVVELAEKKVISNWATVGVYGFEGANLYSQLYQQAYLAGSVQEIGGERYIAPMYQLLLGVGGRISAPKLVSSAVHILGTPQEVVSFDPMAKPPFRS